jgi:hypothetical protein
MELLRGVRKARGVKCEICENREAVDNGLCESCAEGIARLVRIKLPENEHYLAAVVSATQTVLSPAVPAITRGERC